jgi:putative adenylate-forming enzyme
MSVHTAAVTLMEYWRARRIDSIRDATQLKAIQQNWLNTTLVEIAQHSPFYRDYAGNPLCQWPVMTKRDWMQHFDTINTVGAHRTTLEEIALNAEATRDFGVEWQGYSVGLSTGTSGARGLFIASPAERARWAGTLLGKFLRSGLLANERIALVLRAGNTLYDSIRALRLQFRYFDSAQPWQQLTRALQQFSPTIIVATPQHLARLAGESARPAPRRVVSAAEVLDDVDRKRIETGFDVHCEQIYQATEGLLGATCEHGNIHLNEPYLMVEREWQDAEQTRFVPIITDLRRRSQPVIRYRLDDVLRLLPKPCPCGRPTTALAGVDGRHDDVLWLFGNVGDAPVFPDLITRAVVRAIPTLEDYEVVEQARGRWLVKLLPTPDAQSRSRIEAEFQLLAAQLDVRPPDIELESISVSNLLLGKRRRVRGLGGSKTCAF